MIRSKPSVNAAETVGKIFDRFRIAQGWQVSTDGDHELRVAVWLEILGTARIPAEFYERLYQKAMVERGFRKGRGEQIPFFITPEELIAQYDGLLRENAEKAHAPKRCAVPHDDEADCLVEYIIWNNEAVLLPCHSCRSEAHETRKKERIEQRRGKTLRLVEKSE